MRNLKLPLKDEVLKNLRAGESGIIYTARDQAHKRLNKLLMNKKRLPFDLKGATIYYCGPTKRRPCNIIGSCGPTTSSRMDSFTPPLLKAGLKGMIGKGARSKQVKDAVRKYRAVYFVAVGGAGAYLSMKVKRARPIAFKDLGPEAIYRLEVKDFPVIVAIDTKGRSVFK